MFKIEVPLILDENYSGMTSVLQWMMKIILNIKVEELYSGKDQNKFG